MKHDIRAALIGMACLFVVSPVLSNAQHPQRSAATRGGLRDPAKKEIAMQLVSAAENSSLDWKAQYGYIEYNVERDPDENRGYTGGTIGFTSRTHDMLKMVRYYDKIAPNNFLTPFLPSLEKVDGTSSVSGLGEPFVKAWKAADTDPKFREAQDRERDRVYFEPAVSQAEADGLLELGQFVYYDAIVMHGPGNGRFSFGGIRASAMKHAKLPSLGGDETAFLNAFLNARRVAMKSEKGHQETSRVDTMQRKFVAENNLRLDPPLKFQVYGDKYEIPKSGK